MLEQGGGPCGTGSVTVGFSDILIPHCRAPGANGAAVQLCGSVGLWVSGPWRWGRPSGTQALGVWGLRAVGGELGSWATAEAWPMAGDLGECQQGHRAHPGPGRDRPLLRTMICPPEEWRGARLAVCAGWKHGLPHSSTPHGRGPTPHTCVQARS